MVLDEQWLRAVCNTPCGPFLRPFAPNSEWRNASVFVVGTNPATPLRDEFRSFDDYWRALTHVPDEFRRVYRLKHESGQSKTTRRVSELLKYLSPLNALVTNVYSYPAPKPKLISNFEEQKRISEQIFDFLLTICKPQALFFHGSVAANFARGYFGVSLDPYAPPSAQATFITLPSADTPTWIYAYVHMSGLGVRRGFRVSEMDSHLQQFARQIRSNVHRA